MGARRLGAPRSVAAQILVLQLVVVLVVVTGGLALAVADAVNDQRRETERTVLAVATTVADAPVIAPALRSADPTVVLQPFAERVRVDAGVDFVVIMSVTGQRYTHPDPNQIGGRFLGSIEQAASGVPHVEEYTGTLGPSVRAVVPVRADTGAPGTPGTPGTSGPVIALVGVGVTTASVSRAVAGSLPSVLAAGAAALVLGFLGAWLIGRRLHRQTQGLAARELTRRLDYYDAVLHSVREGLLLLDTAGTVRLANDEARRLLGLDPDPRGRPVTELGLPAVLVERLGSAGAGSEVRDEIFLVGERVLVVNRADALRDGRALGSVVTLRDRTDLQEVTGELATARGLADSLRSQNHEAANRLHTVVSLVELGRVDDAVTFATRELTLAQRLTDQVVSAVADPVLVALLLGKSAQAAERGVDLRIDPGSEVGEHLFDPHDLVTVLGNLVDNAVDATASTIDAVPVRGGRGAGGLGSIPSAPTVEVLLDIAADRLRIVVGDNGPGLDRTREALVFERGWSTKTGGQAGGRGVGLALVAATVRRMGGGIDVGTSPLGGAQFAVLVERAVPSGSDRVADEPLPGGVRATP